MSHSRKSPRRGERHRPSRLDCCGGDRREGNPQVWNSQDYRRQLVEAAVRNVEAGGALGGRSGAALLRLADAYMIRAAGGVA